MAAQQVGVPIDGLVGFVDPQVQSGEQALKDLGFDNRRLAVAVTIKFDVLGPEEHQCPTVANKGRAGRRSIMSIRR